MRGSATATVAPNVRAAIKTNLKLILGLARRTAGALVPMLKKWSVSYQDAPSGPVLIKNGYYPEMQ